jgi:4-amino-4-deoxy-L-arabinose transferase-like glycosyltransferase
MSSPESARGVRRPGVVLAAIVLAACGLVASTWHVFGHTWDEPEHIAAGMELLDRGHYDYDIQHPPLARLLLALGPYLAGARSQGKPPPDGRSEGVAILYGGGHYDLYLTLARAGALPFLALLIVVTYALARRVLAPDGALLAAGFLAATPAVLGHAGLATLDVPAAAVSLAALDAFERWLRVGRLREAAWLGLATGIAVGTKLSAIPFIGLGAGVFLLLRLVGRPEEPRSRAPFPRLPAFLVAAFLASSVLTLAYGGHFIYLTNEAHQFNPALGYLFGYVPGPAHDLAYAVAAKFKVPLALQWLIGGIQALTVHNQAGHPSYLFGVTGTAGWWYFYLVALAVKTPLPLAAAGVAGLGLLARDGWRHRDPAALAPPLLFVVLLAFCSLYSHINIGVRHVLVLYPLLALGASVAVLRLWEGVRAGGAGRGALAGAALALGGLWLGVTLARTWPDYLAYFNETVAEPRRVLVDSDLDWGQDFRRLTIRLRALGVPSVALAYLGTADLAREPLPPYRVLGPDAHATGWIAVSALARIKAPHQFDWLDAYVPVERVGKTIDLYYIPPG